MSQSIDCFTLPVLNRKVFRIGFGCCPMGMHGWGKIYEKDLIRAAHAALDNGINLFDTADIYGLGTSEKILGKALKGRRHEAIVATKFGVCRANGKTFYNNSSRWIKQAVDLSLSRLKTDYIDLYQLHYWDGITPFTEIFQALKELKETGKILSFGVTNINPIAEGFIEPIENLATFSLEYSLANRKFEKIIYSNYKNLGICFLSWGSLGQGILSGKYDKYSILSYNDRRIRRTYQNFHGQKLENNLKIIEYMGEILPNYPNKSMCQMAIRWILDQFHFSIALIGIKNEGQIKDNIGVFGWKIMKKHYNKLCQLSDICIDID